jgi:hypothetical protein
LPANTECWWCTFHQSVVQLSCHNVDWQIGQWLHIAISSLLVPGWIQPPPGLVHIVAMHVRSRCRIGSLVFWLWKPSCCHQYLKVSSDTLCLSNSALNT